MGNLRWANVAVLLVLFFLGRLFAQEPVPWHDPSPHTVQYVTVDENVKLEVLDWGGTGRPIVFLAGLGNTAHVFDDFAPKLTGEYHVYGITRRGYGASSAPAAGYEADRLGDDVLAVFDALKLNRPVLAGHSIAGQELSSIGTRHPERVAGLIYLEAGYQYAFYDASRGDYWMDLHDLRKKLAPGQAEPYPSAQLIQGLLQTDLPRFERDLQNLATYLKSSAPAPPPPSAADLSSFAAFASWQMRVSGFAEPEAEQRQHHELTPTGLVAKPLKNPNIALEILEGGQTYTDIRVPMLAIYAVPHNQVPYLKNNPAALAAAEASDTAVTETQAKAFERGVPSARVVRLPYANHYVFLSNEADVLREMRAFLATLP